MRKEYKVTLASIILLIPLTACIPSIYKEGVITNRQLQVSRVVEAAKGSENINQFCQKIYSPENIKDNGTSIEVPHDISKDKQLNYWETSIFSSYCREKNGVLYAWDVYRNDGAYSSMRGYSKTFLACEINKNIDSAFLYEVFGRDSREYPYEIDKIYLTGNGFNDKINQNQLNGYASSNNMVSIPEIYIDKNRQSGKYSIIFYYENNTNTPQEINLLNSKISIGGKTYDINFSYGREPIHWYYYNDAKANGVFVGDEGKKLSKLKFNPGQKIDGNIAITISGLSTLTKKDVENMTITIDGIKCNNFKKIKLYDLLKTKTEVKN